MTDMWRLPDGRVVSDDDVYDFLPVCIDSDYAERFLNDAYSEIDVCGHPYSAGTVARRTWDQYMWAALLTDLTENVYRDREYGSLSEFGIESADGDIASSSDGAVCASANAGGQD